MKHITYLVLVLTTLIGYPAYNIISANPLASWHMVNVNYGSLQGDANLITIGDQVIMIDAGYSTEARTALVPYLRKLNIRRINHFFVSHPHKDHYEGLAPLLRDDVEIDNLYFKIPPKEICDRESKWKGGGCNYNHVLTYIKNTKSSGIKVHNPKTGFILKLPHNSSIEVLHAQEGDLPNDVIHVNDLSLIMKWKINGFDVLFSGDLNKKLGTVLSSDTRMKSDFLKMPHHGASSIAPNSFFDTVSPKFVLIPGPKGVWCNDRGKQAREWIYSKHLPHWVNGLHGTVRVNFNNNGGEIFRETNAVCSPPIRSKFSAENLQNPFHFK